MNKARLLRRSRFFYNEDRSSEKASEEKTALAGIRALEAFIQEIGLPQSFTELGIPKNTDFRAVADSTILTPGCCKKLTHEEIYEILCECNR